MLDLDQLQLIAEALQCKINRLEAILLAADEVLSPVQQDNAAFFTDRWRLKLQRQRSTMTALQTLIQQAQQPKEQVTA